MNIEAYIKKARIEKGMTRKDFADTQCAGSGCQ